MGSWIRMGAVLCAASGLLATTEAYASGTIKIDDTKWVSVGAGARVSFSTLENSAPNGDDWSNEFAVNNGRIYINGQIHKYLKFEFNTECVFCGSSSLGEYVLLDAIAKFEFSSYFNVWAGRLLVPAERQELNGPFFSSTFDAYKTPFFPSDFSVDFGIGGAGVFARDHGVNVWGAIGPLQYVFGIFTGLQSAPGLGPNQSDNPLVAGRVAFNFLNVEKNPGYYTSGTYYGGAGNVLTLGAAVQYQKDGSGSALNPGDFLGLAIDLLFETPVEGLGVLTLNGEFKYFSADYSTDAFSDESVFPLFDGTSFSVVGLYQLPPKVGIGKLQPYARYTGVYPNNSSDRDEIEFGLNYIVDGHNARVSAFYQYGDIATKGLNYAPDVTGDKISAVRVAVQFQI